MMILMDSTRPAGLTVKDGCFLGKPATVAP